MMNVLELFSLNTSMADLRYTLTFGSWFTGGPIRLLNFIGQPALLIGVQHGNANLQATVNQH